MMAHKRTLIIAGLFGAAGHAVGVAADLASGYVPGGFEIDHVYDLSLDRLAPLLQQKSADALFWGHYLAVFFIPLGIAGVWQISKGLERASRLGAKIFLFAGGYLIVLGTVYHSTFAFVATGLRAEALAESGGNVAVAEVLQVYSAFSEPLAAVLVSGMALISLLFLVLVGSGRSLFPRWVALANPLFLQLLLSLAIVSSPPPLGLALFVTAYNGTFLITLLVTTMALARVPQSRIAMSLGEG